VIFHQKILLDIYVIYWITQQTKFAALRQEAAHQKLLFFSVHTTGFSAAFPEDGPSLEGVHDTGIKSLESGNSNRPKNSRKNLSILKIMTLGFL
jgi:hypothetical protein